MFEQILWNLRVCCSIEPLLECHNQADIAVENIDRDLNLTQRFYLKIYQWNNVIKIIKLIFLNIFNFLFCQLVTTSMIEDNSHV